MRCANTLGLWLSIAVQRYLDFYVYGTLIGVSSIDLRLPKNSVNESTSTSRCVGQSSAPISLTAFLPARVLTGDGRSEVKLVRYHQSCRLVGPGAIGEGSPVDEVTTPYFIQYLYNDWRLSTRSTPVHGPISGQGYDGHRPTYFGRSSESSSRPVKARCGPSRMRTR